MKQDDSKSVQKQITTKTDFQSPCSKLIHFLNADATYNYYTKQTVHNRHKGPVKLY